MTETEKAIRRAMEREEGCVRSVDPLVRALEQLSDADKALLTVAIERKGDRS